MYSITNDIISIRVTSKGAELQSLYHEQNKLEYMWSGDAKYWGKKSPVLFPIVGGLKENTYYFKGKDYKLNRHGFARDNDFKLVDQTNTSLTFSLGSDEQTINVYPFDFLFYVTYTIVSNKLHITFTVENTGDRDLLFSVGAHPAFAVPLVRGTDYEDYYLQFETPEDAGRWPLSKEGLIENESEPFLEHQSELILRKELFYKDAIVFKDLKSTSISLISDKTLHGLRVNFRGFPYMGIWAAKDADFVCIEPWCGIADSVNTSQNLEEKEGIQVLPSKEKFERMYSIEVF